MVSSAHAPDGELARVAEEGYLFGLPIVLMDATRRITGNVPAGVRPGFGPMNLFTHMRAFPPGDFKEVVRPNFDTLYSILWFDVSDEPLVVSVPDTGGRYYMLPMMDMWTDVFAVVGSRTTGTGAGHYALVGPGGRTGELPDGVARIDTPTPVGWVIGRAQTNGPADYPAVHAIQDGFVATPLSKWPAAPVAPEGSTDPSIDMHTAPLEQVLSLSGVAFMTRLVELMRRHRPHLVDQPLLARLSRLGIRSGEPFDAATVTGEVCDAIEEGAAAAKQRMIDAEPRMDRVIDGWSQPISGMGVYGTDYLRRAIVAKIGLGANRAEDAVYPVLFTDADGTTPRGEVDYVLHFPADRLPPADAFWSVTMYDSEGFPVPNDIERYAIGDRDALQYEPDGSVTLYLQHDDPGEARRSNWLPSPLGPLGVTMRLYGPRPEVLDGSWTPPPLTRA